MVLIRWPQKKKDFKQCKKTAQELSFWNFLRLLLVYFWNTIFFKQKCYWTSSLIAPQMTQYSHWLDPECSGWSVPVDQYPRISNSAATLGGLASIDFIVWANSYSLLGRTRSRCRCWAAIRLCHRPEASGRAVHGEVDWLDIGGQHGRRFVLLRHSQAAEEAIPHLYKQEWKMGVFIWGAMRLHSMGGWGLSGADVQAPWHGVLETVWLLCDEAQYVGCLRKWEAIDYTMMSDVVVTRTVTRGTKLPLQTFSPPLEKRVGHSSKCWP